MKLNFEAVREQGGGWAVKSRVGRGKSWFTAADTFAIPGFMDAQTMAIFIADKLNTRVAKVEDFKKVMRRATRVKRDRQTEGWAAVIAKK